MSPFGGFCVPHPNGAVMNFLIIWLIISVVCTGLVLLSLRFAPSWEEEPMDSFLAESRQDESNNQCEKVAAKLGKVKRTETRVQTPPPSPNLANFAIIRTEEPQS